jgi:hypothetical protein
MFVCAPERRTAAHWADSSLLRSGTSLPTNQSKIATMNFRILSVVRRRSVLASLAIAIAMSAQQAFGAFHLWAIREIYTNNSGNLQFIEMFDQFGGQPFVDGMQIVASNAGNTQTHTFTVNGNTPDDTFNHALLFGTAGLAAAGGPTPDYILPNNFLFPSGGSISFFGLNSGSYTGLPSDGNLSLAFGSTATQSNGPQNFNGVTGHVVPEPEPVILATSGAAALLFFAVRRRSRLANAAA